MQKAVETDEPGIVNTTISIQFSHCLPYQKNRAYKKTRVMVDFRSLLSLLLVC